MAWRRALARSTPAREGIQICERLENVWGGSSPRRVSDGTRAYLAAIQGQADEVSRLVDRASVPRATLINQSGSSPSTSR